MTDQEGDEGVIEIDVKRVCNFGFEEEQRGSRDEAHHDDLAQKQDEVGYLAEILFRCVKTVDQKVLYHH